eukprot:CAMPEP_0118643752 /NCGR_PEP_ID=MMETSP0785-20121206/6560_1 /TAXON_ID=91992 /ORGANISM="Bolidomonas pacifica, Strain CCMP 1866" /LENGTH=1015 /DNA_ID=CAMNT_0006535439 /DNA_START=1240 /DNA_END=4283 /DNA_ORIENTATION=-
MAEKMKSLGLKSLIDTKDKQLESVKSALSEQKEALDSLIADQGDKEGEEKMKYMKMMGELNKKMEEIGKREAELGEREVLLEVREKEVGVMKETLDMREKGLEVRAKGVEEREKGVGEREKGVEMEAKKIAETMKVVEVKEGSGGGEEEIERLKEQLKKFSDIADSESDLNSRKEKLFETEAEFEELERALERRKKEWDVGSQRLNEMEAKLKSMERELSDREKSLESRKKELEEEEMTMKEKFDKVGLESEGLLHHDHPEGEEGGGEGGNAQGENRRKSSISVQPSSFKDMQVIAELREQVEELEEKLKEKEKEILLLQGDIIALEENVVAVRNETDETKGVKEDELRVMVDDYEKRMGDITRLRAELEEKEESLKNREEALKKRTTEVEEHLAAELVQVETMKVKVQTSGPPGALSGVEFDWFKGDYRGNEDQFGVLLMMVEDWVKGMKEGSWCTGEGGEDGLVLLADGEGQDGKKRFKLKLTEMHVNPLTSIYGVFKDALEGPLRRKFQSILTQVERFGGFLTPEVCRTELFLAREDLEREMKKHRAAVEESSAAVSQVERQMVKLINQAKANPEMSYSVVRNVVKKWGEKLEALGKVVGRQDVLGGEFKELAAMWTGYVKVLQDIGEEDLTGVAEMTREMEKLRKDVESSKTDVEDLGKRRKAIGEQIGVLGVEYEMANGKQEGGEYGSLFEVVVENEFVNPDEDMADPAEIKRLNVRIEDLLAEIEDLKGDKYEKMMSSDGSYGGLMFFAFLQEPHFEEKMEKIIVAVNDLWEASKGGGGKHLSYSDLQKMVENIARHKIPLLSKIKSRYSKLHKKWSDTRVKMMKELSLSGGDGDVAAICPVCNLDRRNVRLDKREGTKELKGGVGQLSKKIERPVKQVQTSVSVMKMGKSWKRKSDIGKLLRNVQKTGKKEMSRSLGDDGSVGSIGSLGSLENDVRAVSREAGQGLKRLGAVGKKGGGMERVRRKSREKIEVILQSPMKAVKAEKVGRGGGESPTLSLEQTGWSGVGG